jgi:hypothetical protein
MAARNQSALAVILGRVYVAGATFVALGAPSGFFNSPEPYLNWLAGVFCVWGMAYAVLRAATPKYALVLGAVLGPWILAARSPACRPASAWCRGRPPPCSLRSGCSVAQTSPVSVAPRKYLVVLCVGLVLVMAWQDADFYFNRYRTGHYFEDAGNETALLVNQQAAQLGPGYRLFLFGEPRSRSPTPISPPTPAIAKQEPRSRPARWPPCRATWGPSSWRCPSIRAELEQVAQLLPGGQWQRRRAAILDEPAYFVHLLTAEQPDPAGAISHAMAADQIFIWLVVLVIAPWPTAARCAGCARWRQRGVNGWPPVLNRGAPWPRWSKALNLAGAARLAEWCAA